MVIRSTLLVSSCLLVLGCGRLGFEPPGDDPRSDASPTADGTQSDPVDAVLDTGLMLVDNRPNSVEIRAPGRFSLTFDAAHKWQVSDWRDLETDPATNLVNPGENTRDSVLLAPLAIEYGGQTLTLDDGTSPSLEIYAVTSQMIELSTEWYWFTLDMRTIEGEVTHIISIDGQWSVRAELKNKASGVTVDQVQLFTSNVERALGWDEEIAPDGTYYRLTLSGASSPRSQLEVDYANSGPVATDVDGNHYWTRDNVIITSFDGWETRADVRIWPPVGGGARARWGSAP